MRAEWVFNASPLILLGKAELLNDISPVAEKWIIPEGVIGEIEKKSPFEAYLLELSRRSQVTRERVDSIHPLVAAWDLGQGESEVLTLGLTRPTTAVVLDDALARKCARVLGVPVTGTLGLLLLAKRVDILPVIRPAVQRLISAGLYIDPETVSEILHATGEQCIDQ